MCETLHTLTIIDVADIIIKTRTASSTKAEEVSKKLLVSNCVKRAIKDADDILLISWLLPYNVSERYPAIADRIYSNLRHNYQGKSIIYKAANFLYTETPDNKESACSVLQLNRGILQESPKLNNGSCIILVSDPIAVNTRLKYTLMLQPYHQIRRQLIKDSSSFDSEFIPNFTELLPGQATVYANLHFDENGTAVSCDKVLLTNM